MEEDESVMPKKDARTLVARFNEQIEPIYKLLRETEDVNLAYEVLEPEPTEIPALKQRWEQTLSSFTILLSCSVFICSVRLSKALCIRDPLVQHQWCKPLTNSVRNVQFIRR